MGRAYDATRSYESGLVTLALVTIGAAALMLTLPAPSRGVARRPDDEDRIA